MGSFYANLTVLGPDNGSVITALGTGPALVASTSEGATVVFPAEEDDPSVVGQPVSADLHATVLGIQVHDDDILTVSTWVDGDLVDMATVPDLAEYFDFAPDEVAAATAGSPGHDPARLVAALGRGDASRVREALSEDQVFATDRHAALVAALGLPDTGVGWGYRYLQDDRQRFTGGPLTLVLG